MRRARLAGLLVAMLCSTARAELKVVATTPELGAIAKAVGGDAMTLTVLAKPTEDPHFVDAKPSFITKLNRADALIEGGADLEAGWLPVLLDQARNPKLLPGAEGRISCSQGVPMLEVPTSLDRSKGDIHAAGNPHYLTDPGNARVVATHMADAFARLDPASAGLYRSNLNQFLATLAVKLPAWERCLAPFRGQHVAAYHNSWPYFARRFNLRIDVFLEPKPGIPPTPAHLAEVIRRMKTEHVHAILVEPYQSRKTARTVAAETGAVAIDVSQFPSGVKGAGPGYFDLVEYNVTTLAHALATGATANAEAKPK